MEKNLQKFGLFMGNRAQNSSLPIMDIKENTSIMRTKCMEKKGTLSLERAIFFICIERESHSPCQCHRSKKHKT